MCRGDAKGCSPHGNFMKPMCTYMDRCRCAVVIWLWHKFLRLWSKLCATRRGKMIGCRVSYRPDSYIHLHIRCNNFMIAQCTLFCTHNLVHHSSPFIIIHHLSLSFITTFTFSFASCTKRFIPIFPPGAQSRCQATCFGADFLLF